MAILIRSVHHTGNWYTGDFFSARMWNYGGQPSDTKTDTVRIRPSLRAALCFFCVSAMVEIIATAHRVERNLEQCWPALDGVGGGGGGSGVYVFSKKFGLMRWPYEFVDKAAQYARFPARLPPSKSKRLCNPRPFHFHSIFQSEVFIHPDDRHRSPSRTLSFSPIVMPRGAGKEKDKGKVSCRFWNFSNGFRRFSTHRWTMVRTLILDTYMSAEVAEA